MNWTVAFSVVVISATTALGQGRQITSGDVTSSIPFEPGMYVQKDRGFDKILGQIVVFKRSGSLFVSSLTGGIKTSKENVQLLGPHAQTVVDGKPVFFFIPPKQEAEAGVNAGDLILIRLEEKTKRRQFEIGAQGLWRTSSGISIRRASRAVASRRFEIKFDLNRLVPSFRL